MGRRVEKTEAIPLASYLPTLGAVFIWSSSFICTKLAYSSFPPLALGALRFAIAALALEAYARARKANARPPLGDRLRIALSGILGITLYFSCENIGVSLTSASNAALIVASYPAITLLASRILERRRVEPRQLLGVVVAIVGVALIAGRRDGARAQGGSLGNILLVLAGFVWTGYTLVTRTVVEKYPAETISSIQTRAGALCFIPLACLEGGAWKAPDLTAVSALAYLSLLCSVVAFMLYNAGLKRLPASASVSLMNLVPVLGVLLSALILREAIVWQQVLGGAVIIAGVGLSAVK